MPLYEYLCRACNHSFEMLRRMSDADSELQCPRCHSTEVERTFSTFAAGGCVTDLDGAPMQYGKPEYRNGDFIAWGMSPRLSK